MSSEVRAKLEEQYPEVMDTKELQEKYEVVSFQAPFVEVIRKEDGVRGSLRFIHNPRFYFDFTAEGLYDTSSPRVRLY